MRSYDLRLFLGGMQWRVLYPTFGIATCRHQNSNDVTFFVIARIVVVYVDSITCDEYSYLDL